MNFRERLEHDRVKAGSKGSVSPVAINSVANDNEPQDEQSFDSEFFGIANSNSFPACLDLRLADGKRKALPYSYIQEMDFDVERGIEIIAANKRIVISGRDLGKLFDYLAVFRVRYIQVNVGEDLKDEGLFVGAIAIDELP